MAYSFPGTGNKGGQYVVDELLIEHGAAANLPTMKAIARGVLKALAEDETGFNQAAGSAESVSGGLADVFVSQDNGGKKLYSAKSTVNSTGATINFPSSFSTLAAVTISGVGTGGWKVHMTAATTSGFTWATSDGSTFSGDIHYHARGT